MECSRLTVACVLALSFGSLAAQSIAADEPVHAQIDKLLVAKIAGAPVAAKTTDAEFLRRVYLDFAGRIPTVDETRVFLKDTAGDKRTKLIDQLFAGPEFPRRMADGFHLMLMERQGENEEWQKYLRESFAANKPWDQLVRELLYPDATNEATRASAFFITKRLEAVGQNTIDYPGLVRDVGRLFLGVDVQCAQCHDHLFIKDYKQADFQGLFAFLSPVSIRRDVKFPAVSEKLVDKKIEFSSVFDQQKKEIGPRVPGREEVLIPVFKKGEEFEVPPDRKTNFPGVPKFSPLKSLAEQLPQADNVAFARNMANRVWFLLLGRGLVHPLDLHHSENPPSHPEVMELLTKEIIAHKFDVRWALRELALTDAYQRSTQLPTGVDELPPESYRVALERPLSAEQLLYSTLQATGLLAATKDDELKLLRTRFLAALANPPKEPELEYAPSVKAALFFSNDEKLLSWLAPQNANLAERLSKISDNQQLADELYLSVLTRQPTDDERTEIIAFLTKSPDQRAERIGQAIWALLASTEFSLNH